MGDQEAATAEETERRLLAALRGPRQEFDIQLPRKEPLSWSPDENTPEGAAAANGRPKRRFYFQPLADQTLAQIIYDAGAMTPARIGTDAAATGSGRMATSLTIQRAICEAALVGWENLTDQDGNPVKWDRELIRSMGRNLLEPLADHIYSTSLEGNRDKKKDSGSSPPGGSTGSS